MLSMAMSPSSCSSVAPPLTASMMNLRTVFGIETVALCQSVEVRIVLSDEIIHTPIF